MAVNPPNFGILNQQAGQIILDARNVLNRIVYFNSYIQSIGSAGLVALGFTAEDAALLLAVYGNLASVAQVCNGENYTGPALPFNFVAQSIPLWGGQ